MNRPLPLLIGTGAALGLNFPIGKLAMAAGIDAALWAAMISLGAGLAMLIVSSLAERGRTAGAPLLRFAIISGFVSYVVFWIVQPDLSAGLPVPLVSGSIFLLITVVTLVLSYVRYNAAPAPDHG